MLQLHPGCHLNQETRRALRVIGAYSAIIIVAFAFNLYRLRAQNTRAESGGPEQSSDNEASPEAKPFFSLTTNRSYAPTERAWLWASYKGVEALDFRVYRVKDPVKFFQQLDDPHRVGEDEKDEIESDYRRGFSALEKTRSVKNWIYALVKEYVRDQLKRQHRETFNQKFRQDSAPRRTPLNVADYARVPLLNPSQLVSSWRERLPPMLDEYDGRTISLGQREPGVYLVEAVNGNLRAYCVAIVTDLTMVQKTTYEGELLAYIVDRRTGAPRAGAQVTVTRERETLANGVTDPAGIFKTKVEKKPQGQPNQQPEDIDTEEQDGRHQSFLVMASDHESFAISDLDSFYFGAYGAGYDQSLTGYIYTDRPVYRPEQKVYFKGILRRWAQQGYEMVEGSSVHVIVDTFNGGKLLDETLTLSERGTFAGELEIPAEAPLGMYHITASVGQATASHYFSIQEYKKPEYKVRVTGPKQFAAVGERVRFSVDARYFFGSPVADADVKYFVTRSRYYHYWMISGETDELDDPELMNDENDDSYDDSYYSGYGGDIVDQGEGKLDAKGHMAIDFEVPTPDERDEWDYTYRLEAQVTDASRREMQASAGFTGTRGQAIAFAEPERYIYYQGDQARIKIRTADYLGHAVAGRVTLKFIEHRWEKVLKEQDGHSYTDYEARERELSTVEVETGAAGLTEYDYTVPSTGYIYIKAILHEGSHEVTTRGGSFWAPDRRGAWGDFTFREYGESSIKLIPDKKSYRAGETAHVLAVLPTEGVHLLVTTELQSVMTVRQLDAPGRTVMIDVPIEARYEPNVYLGVAYVKDDELYTDDQLLAVPARDKYLNVEIIPNKKEYKPRETASYTILARNRDGTPAAGAEISLGVVDEAIYSIMPENAGNIRQEFYGRRYNAVETRLARSFAFTGYSGTEAINLAGNRPAYQLADFKNDSALSEPTVRREFKDTAFWQPDVVTGADGRATVKFKLPDNLTTWRATARAVTADTRVGSGIAKVVARKDVIMRLEMPRFLTEGDTVTISGVVHNFLKTSIRTRISLEVSGAQLLSPSTETITIPKMGHYRIDWRVTASQAGEMSLLAKALTDTESDGVEMQMEIVPHGLKQTIAEVTTITEETAEQTVALDLPAHPDVQARKLRIEASPSVAATLFGALDYLTGYPYGCTEQTMSRFLPDVIVAQALKDVQTARIRETNNLGEKVQRGLERLYSFQHADGGWGWWKNDQSDPFMTAYVVDGLTLAARAGYATEQWRVEGGRERLKRMIDEGGAGDDNTRPDAETRAYMIYALGVSGETDASYVDELYAARGNLQPYGRALLALALEGRGDGRAREVADEIERAATVNDFEAHWASRFKSHYGYEQAMDTEATALSLKALARIAPQSPLLAKAARWLVGNRRHGYYWISTRETAFAIFGLTEYLKVSRELEPDYTLEVYIGDEPVISRHITPADVQTAQTFTVERKGQRVGSANRVRIVKRGRGVVYLSSTLEYFTGDEEVAAQSSTNLKLSREYLRLRVTENGNQKSSWTLEPLTGEVRSGDLIVSRLRIEGARAQYLMIEDPIPAGCVQTPTVSGINLSYVDGRWSDWYSAREFRDERTVFFLNYFDGDATFQYAMRVEVPGEFRIAPARAELMYQPTVQSNTSNTRLNILDKK